MASQLESRLNKLEGALPDQQSTIDKIEIWSVESGSMKSELAAVWRKGMQGFELIDKAKSHLD